MKWLTLKSSAILDSGESRSVYEACVHGRKETLGAATGQGMISPELGSLHLKVIERPYRDGEDAFEAIAADHINYQKSQFRGLSDLEVIDVILDIETGRDIKKM